MNSFLQPRKERAIPSIVQAKSHYKRVGWIEAAGMNERSPRLDDDRDLIVVAVDEPV